MLAWPLESTDVMWISPSGCWKERIWGGTSGTGSFWFVTCVKSGSYKACVSQGERKREATRTMLSIMSANCWLPTRGRPYPTKRVVTALGRWRGRKTESRRAIAAPVTGN